MERGTADPLLPLRVVTDRGRAGVYLASLLIGAGMFGMNPFMTHFLQVNLGYSPLHTGLAFLPFSIGVITTTTLAPPLVPRFGPKALMAGGILLAIAGLLWLTRLDPGSGYATAVLPTQILVSVGVGLFYPPVPTSPCPVSPRPTRGWPAPH
ncbi:MFS transporter [Streptomyces sp. NPDC001880]